VYDLGGFCPNLRYPKVPIIEKMNENEEKEGKRKGNKGNLMENKLNARK
jgi:hypothetical protein